MTKFARTSGKYLPTQTVKRQRGHKAFVDAADVPIFQENTRQYRSHDSGVYGETHVRANDSNVDDGTQRCNCYAYSTIKAPDKGEVGGSSPPRPTIQITSKYAAILTFPLLGDLPQKSVLSTVCQLPVSRVGLHSGRSEAT